MTEVPQSKSLIPGNEEILEAVCKHYGIEKNELYKTKRGTTNEPRNISVYLMRRLRKDGLNEIGRKFGIEKYSSVSSIIERVKLLIKKDPALAQLIDEVSTRIIKSQRQT